VKIAVIGEPGAWSTERLATAVRGRGADAEVVDLATCSLRLPDPRLFHRGRPLDGFAGAIVKKVGDTALGWSVRERIVLLRHLEASGVPVLSAPACLETAIDRLGMTVELVRAGLPVPDTLVTESAEEAETGVETFGVAVVKPLFTSKGRGMRKLGADHLTAMGRQIQSAKAALAEHTAAGYGPFYLQRFVKHPGRDLGVAVLEGKVLGAYWRRAGADQWMTTILSGGRYERAEPPEAALELARRAAVHFGLLFTGVDLMETPEGGFIVLEVSAFGGFRGLLDACGIDAAPLFAEAALRRFSQAA
jgi:ribosomal protein S6--L-glutamate ligase